VTQTQERWTPLHSASSAGHTNVVASLLAFGASPNAANRNGQRACHYAASKGHMEVLKKLKHAGADCDVCDKTGATPVHRAASCGNVDVIEFLVNECENVNLESKNVIGQTPLIVACEAGQDEAVLFLARLGADPDAVDDERNGAATLAPKLLPVLRAIKQGDDGV
jgi:26S proteasome non-ATPase regulatory subunit 10